MIIKINNFITKYLIIIFNKLIKNILEITA